MSYGAQRLTCFALISAMETDMRAIMLAAHADSTPDAVLPSDRIDKAQGRRAKDGLRPARTLSGVIDYLDFAHIYEALRSNRSDIRPETDSALDQIKTRLSALVEVRNRVAHTRPMEIDDTALLVDIADTLLGTDGLTWSALGETLDHLKRDPSFVLSLTISLPRDEPSGPFHNLPIPDFDETGFMGRQKELRTIKRRILGAYPIVSVLGDGGVGKTAIALKAAYDILAQERCPFDAIVWVTAKATVLTPHEIQRVSGAIETSLGLFASAGEHLGASADENPIEELYAYLENFRVLLILDNLETVLDATLREFLLELPMGSKVLLTSRIALGIENPVPLEPMSPDESTSLLRALGRARNIAFINSLNQAAVDYYASKMAGHPAYIKWFVSGVQAGRRPEELVNDNGLLLDFCMSNVYEYLGPEARVVLACMQVLPGARNQAELAHLSASNAVDIQSALLELLTTNFIAMSHSAAETFDTLYRLSDFARLYLDKHHPAPEQQRWDIISRSEQLREWGSVLSAEVAQSPYAPDVINVRDRGDVHVAKILREAVQIGVSDLEQSLSLCKEAQALSPGYYEPWRIEGLLCARAHDIAAASYAYGHAYELAPESGVLAYHMGDFYLNWAGEPRRGLEFLQAAAHTDQNAREISGQIAWAHYSLGQWADAIVSAGVSLQQSGGRPDDVVAALSIAGRSAARCLDTTPVPRESEAVETLETAMELLDAQSVELLKGEVGDWFVAVADRGEDMARRSLKAAARSGSDPSYAAARVQQLCDELRMRVRGAHGQDRRLGAVISLNPEKGYGFLHGHRFFHMHELVDNHHWDLLQIGSECAYFEAPNGPKGPRAARIRLMLW